MPTTFSIPSQELADKLAAIQFGVTAGEIASQSDCVIFQSDQMYTFDGQIYCCIAQKFPKDCAVPYKMFKDAIGKTSKNTTVGIFPGENSLVLKRNTSRTSSETTIPYKAEILAQVAAIPPLTEADQFFPFPSDISDNIDALESVIDKTQRGTQLYYIHFTFPFIESANTEHCVRITPDPAPQYPATFPPSALIPAGYLGKIHKLSTLESFLFKNNWMYIKTQSGIRYAFPVITDTAYVDAEVLQQSLYPQDEGVPLILPPELADEVTTGLKFSDDGVAHITVAVTDPAAASGKLELDMHSITSSHKCSIQCDVVPNALQNITVAVHGHIIAKIAKGDSPSVTIYENAVIGAYGNVRYAVSTLAAE